MSEPKRSTSKIIPAKKVVIIENTTLKADSVIDWVTEKKQEIGKVIAVGKGKLPIDIKKGDIIAFRRFGEDKLFFEGKEIMFVTFPDILAKLK